MAILVVFVYIQANHQDNVYYQIIKKPWMNMLKIKKLLIKKLPNVHVQLECLTNLEAIEQNTLEIEKQREYTLLKENN